MRLSEFDFSLPKNLIAKYPKNPRGSSKLLHLSSTAQICDYKFCQITNLFKKGDLLILNDTKVIPVYFEGAVRITQNLQKEVSIYLNRELNDNQWIAFAKPSKLLKVGQVISFENDLLATVIDKNVGTGEVTLLFNTSGLELFNKICNAGKMPIPPYLKRKPETSDETDYQTVFAKNYGSVAAPTAGLHFNQEILQRIKREKVDVTYITLHVGAGTFLPVKTENIEDHKMHYENFLIPYETADIINQKKKEGRRIICVGTTTLRALEASADENALIKPQTSRTNIFIKPGYKFKIADSLITNFHTPKSTLFMLVCAFSGIRNIKRAYDYAIKKKYRFFSYGDSCWLDKTRRFFQMISLF